MFYKYWFYFSIISDGTTDAEEPYPYLIPDGSMTRQVYANDVIETQNQNQDYDGGL